MHFSDFGSSFYRFSSGMCMNAIEPNIFTWNRFYFFPKYFSWWVTSCTLDVRHWLISGQLCMLLRPSMTLACPFSLAWPLLPRERVDSSIQLLNVVEVYVGTQIPTELLPFKGMSWRHRISILCLRPGRRNHTCCPVAFTLLLHGEDLGVFRKVVDECDIVPASSECCCLSWIPHIWVDYV